MTQKPGYLGLSIFRDSGDETEKTRRVRQVERRGEQYFSDGGSIRRYQKIHDEFVAARFPNEYAFTIALLDEDIAVHFGHPGMGGRKHFTTKGSNVSIKDAQSAARWAEILVRHFDPPKS